MYLFQFDPFKKAFYLPYGGRAHRIDDYEILLNIPGYKFVWVSAQMGEIPVGAFLAGYEKELWPLYVARQGGTYLGKINPTHGRCYVPMYGKELGFEYYEVLVLQKIENK